MASPAHGPVDVTAEYLAELPDDDLQYELDEGQLILMAPAGEGHGRVEGDLYGELYALLRGKDLGRLYPSDTGFILSRKPDTVRSPDVSFVRKHRFPLETRTKDGYILGAPDLAVEIQSPHQSPADLERKTRQYLEAGTQTVWVIRPRSESAEIYEAGQDVRTIGADEDLETSVLPGVRLRLGELLGE